MGRRWAPYAGVAALGLFVGSLAMYFATRDPERYPFSTDPEAHRSVSADQAAELAASPDPLLRLRGVRSLRGARNPETARILYESLFDSDERVAMAAAEELALLGDRTLTDHLIALYREGNRYAALALSGLLGPEHGDVLRAMQRSEDPLVRRSAARAADASLLQLLLVDPDETVRIEAARAIRRSVPRDGAFVLFAAALRHEDAGVRRTAAIELGAWGRDAEDLLRRVEDDPDERVRLAAAASLSRISP